MPPCRTGRPAADAALPSPRWMGCEPRSPTRCSGRSRSLTWRAGCRGRRRRCRSEAAAAQVALAGRRRCGGGRPARCLVAVRQFGAGLAGGAHRCGRHARRHGGSTDGPPRTVRTWSSRWRGSRGIGHGLRALAVGRPVVGVSRSFRDDGRFEMTVGVSAVISPTLGDDRGAGGEAGPSSETVLDDPEFVDSMSSRWSATAGYCRRQLIGRSAATGRPTGDEPGEETGDHALATRGGETTLTIGVGTADGPGRVWASVLHRRREPRSARRRTARSGPCSR